MVLKQTLSIFISGLLLGSGIALIVEDYLKPLSAEEFIIYCNRIMGEGNWQVDKINGSYTCLQKRAVGAPVVNISIPAKR